MATYNELYGLRNDGATLEKVSAAVAIAAKTIYAEDGATTNHTNRLIWARKALVDPYAQAQKMIWVLLANSTASTVAQIKAATDAAVQSAVDGVINLFADGT